MNRTLAPGARAGSAAGQGPSTNVAPPGPSNRTGAGTTPFAISPPVFVTVSMTTNDCPVQAPLTEVVSAAASAAGGAIAVTVVALTRTAAGRPPHTAIPFAVIVKVTAPAPVAVQLKTKVVEPPPASVSGPSQPPACRDTNAPPGPA